MSKLTVFALSGYKQSGKDTCAEYLVGNHGFTRYSFADALKDLVSEQYDIPREWCDDPKYKEHFLTNYPVNPKDKFSETIARFMFREFRAVDGYNTYKDYDDYINKTQSQSLYWPLYWTPRAVLIAEGSLKRSINSNYWVMKVINQIVNPFFGNQNLEIKAVITDLRYRSELELLKSFFGPEFKINKNNSLTTIRINRFDQVNSTDPSERDLDGEKFTVTLDNKGKIEDLYKKLDSIAILKT